MDASCLTPQQVAVLTRAVVLIISALSGVLCIYLGWRLYKDAILTPTSGTATTSGFKLKFASAGPGVFFALFGMWLLVGIINRPLQLNNGGPSAKPSSSISAQQPRPEIIRTSSLNNPILALGTEQQKPNECECGQLTFFDGQNLDSKTVKTALSFAIRATALYPEDTIAGSNLKREQVIDILGTMQEKIK